MAEYEYFDYSGAPPILVPKSLAKHWNGFYQLAKDGECPDLILDSLEYIINDNFNFSEPETDYDTLCGLLLSTYASPSCFIHEMNQTKFLAFGTILDLFAWWEEELIFVNGAPMPNREELSTLEWTCLNSDNPYIIEEEEHILLNSCDHGAAPQEGEYANIRLPLGKYLIEMAETKGYWRYLFKLKLIP